MHEDDAATNEARILWRSAQTAVARTEPQRGAPAKSPLARYVDPSRHAREVAALRRLPHAIGPAARLVVPGDWLSTELLGVPVLAVIGEDGELRAFINVCRHRGTLVVAEGAGSGRSRFVCPYHSWTYDSGGALVGRPHESDFPHVPRRAASLVPLPAASRAGLIWVVPTKQVEVDWDDYFGPLGAELERLGYDRATASQHERRFVQPSNWKLVLDANLESYHFQYAHRATISHLFHDNVVQQASFGRHQRIVLPRRSLPEEGGQATVDWELLGRHSHIIYFFFPATFLLWEGDHANVFNVHPLTLESCRASSWMIVPRKFDERRSAEHWQRNWKIFWDTLDEDYALAASMQKGLTGGANEALVFGANEFACELFESAVDELVAAPGDPCGGGP